MQPAKGTRQACAIGALAISIGIAECQAQGTDPATYVNWESPHVHPLELMPQADRLVAVNTADNRIEVFRLNTPDGIVHRASIDVGLEPISVRAADASTVWVVNRISDTVSIVDLDRRVVTATISVGDEPGDVAFANGRAFISTGTANAIEVYDLPYVTGAAPTIVPIDGEDPRALGTDGTRVFAAIFNAGNRTGVLHHLIVTTPAYSPYAGSPMPHPFGLNPPPNAGIDFEPPINPALLVDADGDGILDIRMPRSSLIAKEVSPGLWMDDNNGDWSTFPTWTQHGHALAAIDASTLEVGYATGLMTHNFAIDVNPIGHDVTVVGTHAFNHVRFEPNVRGRFVSVGEARITGDLAVTLSDPNPHLSDFFPDPHSADNFRGLPPIDDFPIAERVMTLGDPRGVAWMPDGSAKLITGRGSNNVVVTDQNGSRIATFGVGQGPTGVATHPDGTWAYVLNQFDGSISIIDTDQWAEIEVERATYHDPTPAVIRDGRPHFYGTHASSAFGQASCQSCHLDGAMDLLAWDLGDPSGEMKTFNQICIGGSECVLDDWHPMKGPMATQTLFGIIGNEPFHWRGDKEDLSMFNPAFESLQGASQLLDGEMQAFENFVATLRFPPNPYRETTGELPTVGHNGGNPQRGELLFGAPLQQGMQLSMGAGHPTLIGTPTKQEMAQGGQPTGFNCISCHALPTGSSNEHLGTLPVDAVNGFFHVMKVAHLRDLYRKDGFSFVSPDQNSRATGFLHDGSFDTLDTFLDVFFGMSPQDKLDMEAFLFAFATDTHAGIGSQVTIGPGATAADYAARDLLVQIASADPEVGLIAKGIYNDEHRGFFLMTADQFQSDRADEAPATPLLDDAAGDRQLTYTLVPANTQVRAGVDRDQDGFFDRDELDTCHDPADPESFPGDGWCCADIDRDHVVEFDDIVAILAEWGPCADPEDCPTDLDGDGKTGFGDLIEVLAAWGPCPGWS